MPERFENESTNDNARLDEMFAPPPGSLKREPRHQVIARLAGPDEAAATVSALIDAGVATDEVFVLCGEGAVQRLDPTGRHHGLKGRLVRAVQTIFGAEPFIAEDAQFLEHGGVIVAAPARDSPERKTVTQILREQGGTKMRYHGDMTWEDVG